VYGLGALAAGSLPEPPSGAYDVVSCIFRLENVQPSWRAELVRSLARWVKPGGKVLVGYVSRRSFHDLTEWLRERRGGPGGVEYVLAPDPNVGPFESLVPDEVERLCTDAGLAVSGRRGAQPVPSKSEIEFRTRNFSPRQRRLAASVAWVLRQLGRLPGLAARRGRFQFLLCTRPR
jgi:SAM-dependent methyltransferase